MTEYRLSYSAVLREPSDPCRDFNGPHLMLKQ